MSVEKRRLIASKGGKTAQAKGTAHKWTKEEASHSGKIGGTGRKGWRKYKKGRG